MRPLHDKKTFIPPSAPLEMPVQIIERARVPFRSWPAIVRQLLARLAFHE